jgi:hypothetical protein
MPLWTSKVAATAVRATGVATAGGAGVSLGRRLSAVPLVALLLVAPEPAPAAAAETTAARPQSAWTGFDSERFRLRRGDDGWWLESADGLRVTVPAEWLAPPEAVAADEEAYVSSLAWEEEVTAFAAGGGRLALHLSSYAIQQEGSAAAASGRDLVLLYDPAAGILHRGLDLAESKGRVRLGGCFLAFSDRLEVGDVGCDRLLDLAVTEERIDCVEEEPGGIDQPVHRVGPRRWYLQEGDAWVPRPELDGRLPCAGLQQMPLVGIDFGPVDFVLRLYAGRPPLLPPPSERPPEP